MPKVSIIVPFYNVEGYIEKCLDTLVNQTLKDIEIILVNDGSKDNSEFIVKIDDVDINGNGVTRINNLVVFVKNALKDEIVKIKIISLNKRFASAEIVEIIEKSSIREDIK